MNQKDLTKTHIYGDFKWFKRYKKYFRILRVEASKDQIVSVLSLVISK